MVNINESYSTLAERMAAARSALMRTTYGMGGVIRIEPDGDRVKYVLTATGESFANVDRAFNAASSLHITQVNQLNKANLGNKVSGLAEIMSDMKSKVGGLSAGNRQVLINAGIDVDKIGSMEVSLLTMHADKGGTKGIASRIAKMRERGELHGITIMDDEGARVLNMRVGNQMLSSYQSNLLLSITGHDMLDPDTFASILNKGDSTKLADKLMKVGKRFRSLASEREVALAGGDLSKFIGAYAKNLSDSALIIDPQYELLKKMAHGGKYDFGSDARGKALNLYYKKGKAEDFVGSIMNQLTSQQKDDLMSSIRSANFTYDKKGRKFASDQLLDHLKKNFTKGDANLEKIVNNMFNNIEFAYDGSDLLNERYLKNYVGRLDLRKKNIAKTLRINKNLSAEEKEALSIELKNISNIQRQVTRSGNMGGMQQITGRGNIAGYGNIKTAFDVTEFESGLNRYSMVLSKMGLKGELGLAGDVDILNLSGLGVPRDLVYADPVSASFHPEVFADEDTIKAVERRTQNILQEFEGAIKNNVVPQKVKAMLEQAAERSVEHLPSYARGSAARNRQFASAILEMLQSGVTPSQHPTLMNMMHTFFANEAFRTKDNFVQAVLPDTYRFAIDSEAIVMGTKNGRQLLNEGRGFEKISISGLTPKQQANLASQDILKFRVSGHKMMFSADAIGPFRHALGGFDLDDKGLPKLLTYTDNQNMSRLGFTIFRQPSGPEELIFARMNMDQETIRALFGGKEDLFAVKEFRKSLDSLASTATGAQQKTYKFLQEILDNNHTKQVKRNGKMVTVEKDLSPKYASAFEEAIVNVYKDLETREITKLQRLSPDAARRIAKHGSSALKVSDLDKIEPAYTRQGVFKAFTESGVFNIKDEILSTMQANKVDQKLISKLSKAQNFEDMMQMMGSTFTTDPSMRAAFQTAIEEVSIKKAIEGGDILGLYVNRSMTVGSTLNQYEAFLNNADSRVRNYMLENYRIGLLSQETAIDLSVNFAGTRALQKDLTGMLSSADAVLYNQKGIQKALAELGLAGAGGTDMTLDIFGQQSIGNLGKMIGFSRAVGAQDESQLLGIDEFLLTNRMKGNDTKILLDNIITGMQEAQQKNFAQTANLDATIEELQKISSKNDEELIRKALIDRFSLAADHKYASIGKLHDVGVRYESYFDSLRRASISALGQDDILASTRTTQEAQSAAKFIIDKHRTMLDEVFNINKDALKEMTELEKFNHAALLDSLGENVFSDIDAASKVAKINMADLVNAIDKETAGTRIDIGGLRYLSRAYDSTMTTKGEEVAQRVQQARDLRRIQFYERFDQDYANQVRANLGNKATMDEILQEAQRRIDEATTNGTQVDDVYRALVGQSDEIADDMVRADANQQAAIIQAQMRKEELEASGVIDSLQKEGTIIDMEQAVRELGEDSGLSDDLIKSIDTLDDTAVKNKAVYKRIGEKSGELKELFKNPIIKKSTLAIGALVMGSLAYSAIRDRTHEDMTGPPLLPGGSAYEKEFPVRIPEIGTFNGPGYNPGISYKVNLYGDENTVRRFNAAAGGLVNGNINTTMYNRIPDVADDPYSRMAASY